MIMSKESVPCRMATREQEQRTMITKFSLKKNLFLSLAFLGVAFVAPSGFAQAADKPKMATETPTGI
jgi:hypothetical protein